MAAIVFSHDLAPKRPSPRARPTLTETLGAGLVRSRSRLLGKAGGPGRPESTDSAGQDGTKWNIALAVEAPHLGLPDRCEICRAGVDRNAGQQHRQFEIVQAGRLPHHVLAGQLVAALLEDLDCRL